MAEIGMGIASEAIYLIASGQSTGINLKSAMRANRINVRPLSTVQGAGGLSLGIRGARAPHSIDARDFQVFP
ncbi:hypothetical protein [Ottowia sp.]|uniref:hypothetical protein n=1 Tax=Ottowia sp. TaxID=1898956 RepID=UPI0025F40890|nr:hypothetical protein [Ottowia sp.]MBK6613069.1 hypothetical protein [Ottowia sp.]MBK6747820.1 hypothetical protein [Ottowia sp.]